uniref:Uncharacterized protein n=1 Tax=Sphaerodactylus townsendi TaxID=933632 RepID=A0ACB8G749_9SAUR
MHCSGFASIALSALALVRLLRALSPVPSAAGTVPTCASRPPNQPFQPLLFRFSVVDGTAPEPLHPSLCPSLESVELASPSPSGSPFCPRLKALSCEEVCLLAGEQGQVFGRLSPNELLPIRLSPIGAYSPPARSALPFLDSPDLAVLLSPLFPRSRTFPTLAFPTRQVPELLFGACCPLNSQPGAGRGRMSQESTGASKPGRPAPSSHTRSLNALYWRVSRLAPLRSSQQRFHAFILGLLNMKQLELWFSHLQQNTELISALYLPSAFLVLAQGFCRRWAEELLLLLQPLSTLTFQLDLLFEYHHLSLDVRPAPHHATTPTEPPATSRKAHGPSCLHLARPQGAAPGLTEGPLAQSSPLHVPQVGVGLPQRLLQWGDRLTHTLRGSEAPHQAEPGPLPDPPGTEEKQSSWWERLNQAAGVYADSSPSSSNPEGSPFARWTKLRKALEEAVKEARTGTGSTAVGSDAPSPRESTPEMLPKTPASETESSPGMAAEWKPETSPSGSGEAGAQEADGKSEAGNTPAKGQRLGWLFGANCSAVSGSPTEPDSSMPKSSRRPSSWLPPSVNVLALVMKPAPAEKSWAEESWEKGQPDSLQPYRAVRALCDHAGIGADHLSFRKGDILQVLDTVNEDWIQCCHGNSRGLVPVGYTSLIL